MWTLLLITALGVAPPTTEIQTLGGQVHTGPIKELNGRHVIVETTDGPVSVDLEQLAGLVPKTVETKEADRGIVRVEMADGTSLAALEYSAGDGLARIDLVGGQTLEMPTQDVLAVRLQADDDVIADQWAKTRHEDVTTDRLVVRKGALLDFHRGVVGDVNHATIQFQLDGDVLAVKRAKVFGIVYYHSLGRDLPEPLCRLTDTSGSIWMVRDLSLDDEGLSWTTLLGQQIRRPLASVARIDFSRGKIVYLSDLEPDSLDWSPYLGGFGQLAARAEFYAPRKDTNLAGVPLELNGKMYPKGVALHSRTEVVYRLPGDFRRFKAIAGIDDAVRPRGNVHLVVRGDGRLLYESEITGSDPPESLDFDISGVRRLTVLVDFGKDLDVADHLDLCDARIVK
ncbi:MAG: hypothetical protein GXY83_00180 [Rhodopirellula sp.]|nr:hypothetical protein [Rhodopirellula sp.]